MPFDPTKPVENTPLDAAQMRAQLNALKALIDDLTAVVATKADKPVHVEGLMVSVSDPPLQSDVQQPVDKINELIAALQS